jgi:hypothetical protein
LRTSDLHPGAASTVNLRFSILKPH